MDKNIISQKITDTLELNYMPYAMSVIVSRALPEIDGFKPSHRKLLYTMYKMGLLKGDKIKSANVVGQTMKLNPHGDGAIYETLVRLTAGNDALLHPFIDSKGNFGKQYSKDMAYAASRYTEVKLDAICQEIFKDIDKGAVDFVYNYDNTTTEPLLFPTTFPNILVSPNIGIAVGMSSSISSFNLKEVCDTTIAYIKDRDCDLLKTLKAPDFSMGGKLLYNEHNLRKIYETGKGSVKLFSNYTYDEKNNCIEITEIPYSTNLEVIIDKIISLIKANKIKDITDIRDETGLNGLKIAIDVKKNTNVDMLMHKLYAQTPLADSFSCNFNVLINGQPQTLGVREILYNWLDFRLGCIRRVISHDLKAKSDRLNMLEGLSKIILDIDKAIKIIRDTEEDKEVIPNLIKGFGITEEQAEFIAEIKLRNLNKQYLLNKISEKDELIAEIARLKELYDSDKLIEAQIIDELKKISKTYGKPRRTEIITTEEVSDYSDDELIEDYSCKLFLSREGYFKKITLVSLRGYSEQKLKDGDEIIQEIDTVNKSEVWFFSNKQNLYKLRVHEISECKASVLGDYLGNLLSCDDDEKILYMINVKDDLTGNMIFGFENGKFAAVPLSAYETKTNRKKLVNAYSDKSPLVFIAHALDDIDIMCYRDNDKKMLFNSSLIPVKTTKNTQGVQVLKLKIDSIMEKAYVVSPEVLNKEDEEAIPSLLPSEVEFFRVNKIPSTGHFIQK